jgi:AraC-like DNA-binding protein
MTHAESRARRALVPTLFRKGATVKGIARQLKVHEYYVQSILRQAGVDPVEYSTRARNAEIRRLRMEGWSPSVLAEEFGLTQGRISQITGPVRKADILAHAAAEGLVA